MVYVEQVPGVRPETTTCVACRAAGLLEGGRSRTATRSMQSATHAGSRVVKADWYGGGASAARPLAQPWLASSGFGHHDDSSGRDTYEARGPQTPVRLERL